MKVLMTASTFPRWPGDTEPPFVYNIAKNLSSLGQELSITLLAPHCQGAKAEESLDSFKVYRFRYFFSRYENLCYHGGILANIKENKLRVFLIPFFIILQVSTIKKIVKRDKIDIIHAHWLIPQGLVAVLYKKLFNPKIKIICTVHGGDVFALQNNFFSKLKKWILANLDTVSAVSQFLATEVFKYYPHKKIIVVPNSVDTALFQPQAKSTELKEKYKISDFCLLFVGRLVEKKGTQYLIEAMPDIVSLFPKIKLLIVGAGPETDNLKNQTKKLGLADNIIYLGGVANEDLPSYYNLADIFIGPSVVAKDGDTEGFGIVFIEALACGAPVVTTNVGGITDIVKNNQTGLIVEQKNSKSISVAVLRLLKDNELRKDISQKGRSLIAEKFSQKIISHKYYGIYQALLD